MAGWFELISLLFEVSKWSLELTVNITTWAIDWTTTVLFESANLILKFGKKPQGASTYLVGSGLTLGNLLGEPLTNVAATNGAKPIIFLLRQAITVPEVIYTFQWVIGTGIISSTTGVFVTVLLHLLTD